MHLAHTRIITFGTTSLSRPRVPLGEWVTITDGDVPIAHLVPDGLAVFRYVLRFRWEWLQGDFLMRVICKLSSLRTLLFFLRPDRVWLSYWLNASSLILYAVSSQSQKPKNRLLLLMAYSFHAFPFSSQQVLPGDMR